MIRVGGLSKSIIYVLLIVYLLNVLVPFFMMVMNSFKPMRDLFLRPFSLPSHFVTTNFIMAWKQAGIGTGYKNSAVVASATVVGVIILSSMFAYAISKYAFPMRKFLFSYAILGLALPARLAVIPLFLLLKNLNLTNSLFGLIIIYTAVNLPFSIFLLKNFIDDIPNELLEAARIDGATPVQVYRKVILPLAKPAISIVSIVTFVNVWNDFFFPLIFLNDKSKATITMAVSTFFGEYSNRWDLLFAGLTLAIAPSLILYFFLSRQFIAGMTQGAIK